MNKYIVIPDSFKGTMSSLEVCDIMEKSILSVEKNAEVVKMPVADGGEGSVDAILQTSGGKKVSLKTCNPYMEEIDSFYGLIDDGKTAVIEMAASAGLPLVFGRENAKATTTYGVGELVSDAIDKGAKKIILCLGGSATNDCGVGMLSALGAKFFDQSHTEFLPTGGTLDKISDFELDKLKEKIKNVHFVTMCDIDNPLFGRSGAAYVFARQKGATDEDIALLDENMRKFSSLVEDKLSLNFSQFGGAGAAGGMGFCAKTFFNSEMQMGIETVLELAHFDEIAMGAKAIFTGEGKMDGQSLRGKVVVGIAKRAKNLGVPVIAVVGDIGENAEKAYELGVSAIFSINRVAKPYLEMRHRAKSDMALTMVDIMRLMSSAQA